MAGYDSQKLIPGVLFPPPEDLEASSNSASGQGEREGGSEIQRTWRPMWLEHRSPTQADLEVRP